MIVVPESRSERLELINSVGVIPIEKNEDEGVQDLTNPIYKQASRLYGDICRMSYQELRVRLRQLKVDTRGTAESCRKRLKKLVQNGVAIKTGNRNVMNQYYDFICVIDFEATCERNVKGQVQEIVEFPAFIVDLQKRKIVASFHAYVKPKGHITEFCTELTGITQSVADAAQDFVAVLDKFEIWLFTYIKEHNVRSFAFGTDGPWDFAHFLARQCELSKIRFPDYAKRWINIKKMFAGYYKHNGTTLTQMMAFLGLAMEGRLHCGFDDTHNIASVLIRMLHDGAIPIINERISWHAVGRIPWGTMRCGHVKMQYNRETNGLVLSDSEDSDFEN